MTFREELTPIVLKQFQKITEEETLPNPLYEAIITVIQTRQRYHNKRNVQAYITEHGHINLQQNTSKLNPTIY